MKNPLRIDNEPVTMFYSKLEKRSDVYVCSECGAVFNEKDNDIMNKELAYREMLEKCIPYGSNIAKKEILEPKEY